MSGTESSNIYQDPAEDLAADFSKVAQLLFSAGSVHDTLDAVVALAVATVEGCDFAGIFLLSNGVVTTPAHTDPVVTEIDNLQHRSGEGPCLDAIAHRAPFYAEDLGDDLRWSRFGPDAVAKGLRSLFAVPLGGAEPGALNLYASYPRAFGVVDRARGLLLASLAGLALSSARTHETQVRLADNLHTALRTRELIGQAQGILIERERITPDQAFEVLRRASQHLNRKLREVAQDLVDTGEWPDTGERPVGADTGEHPATPSQPPAG